MDSTEIFRLVVSLSLSGSILVIGLFLVKLLLRRKLSANWHYYIWFVLLLRLLIPFTPSTSFSVLNLIPHYDRQAIDLPQISMPSSEGSTAVIKTNENSPTTMPVKPSGNENVQYPSAASAKTWFDWRTSALIWMTGFFGISLYILVVNGLLVFKTKRLPVCDSEEILRILQECKSDLNVHSKVSVVYDDSLKSPALFGLFSPKIIISPAVVNRLSPDELRYIFLHELSHLKRYDLVVNGLVLAVQSIYWFNPLIWYALRRMKQDCEMACDATALAALKPEDHKKYGQTIISLLQLLSEPHWAPGTLGFVNKFNTRRIVMISRYKKTTIQWAFAALALVLVVGCSSLNNPINPANSSQNEKSTTGSQQKDTGTNSQQNTNPGTPTSSTSPGDSKSIPLPATETKPVKVVADYFPLVNGSSWQYQGEGNEYASYVTTVLYTKGNRAQTSEANGGTVSASVFEVSSDSVTKVFFQGEEYEGTEYLDRNPNQNAVILKAPLEVGTKWQYLDGTREIVDTNAVVVTPAGKFEHCIKVKIEGQHSIMYEYYKDGVGLVKKEFISGDTQVTSALETYNIK